LTTATYVTPTFLGDFDSVWRSLGEDNEAVETFALTALNSIQGKSIECLLMTMLA
jgi:hypothetical protein